MIISAVAQVLHGQRAGNYIIIWNGLTCKSVNLTSSVSFYKDYGVMYVYYNLRYVINFNLCMMLRESVD